MAVRDYELLKLKIIGHVAVITLNRPEKLNALNTQLIVDLHSALDELSSKDVIRVVILTGAGRGFCSGADVNELLDNSDSNSHSISDITTLTSLIRQNRQPVIAAVNGIAAGAGLAIALACDVRFASWEARFSSIFIKRSLVPDCGTSYTLPRLVGLGVAMEMALSGNIYDAQWALEKGLVNRVVPPANLMNDTMSLANDIALNPPICVRSTRDLIYEHYQDMHGILERERVADIPASDSEDALEALRSFLEKRRPVFKGR